MQFTAAGSCMEVFPASGDRVHQRFVEQTIMVFSQCRVYSVSSRPPGTVANAAFETFIAAAHHFRTFDSLVVAFGAKYEWCDYTVDTHAAVQLILVMMLTLSA